MGGNAEGATNRRIGRFRLEVRVARFANRRSHGEQQAKECYPPLDVTGFTDLDFWRHVKNRWNILRQQAVAPEYRQGMTVGSPSTSPGAA